MRGRLRRNRWLKRTVIMAFRFQDYLKRKSRSMRCQSLLLTRRLADQQETGKEMVCYAFQLLFYFYLHLSYHSYCVWTVRIGRSKTHHVSPFYTTSRRIKTPLSWSANKLKIIVRSTIAAEAFSLQEGLEDAIFLRTILEEIKGLEERSVPINAHVDSKNIVEAIYSTEAVDDQRLRLTLVQWKNQ